jgi:hypothetical protein
MQRREGQLHLRLHPGDLHQATTGRLPGAVTQQRGFADPGLTPQDQHGTFTATNTVQHPIQGLAFAPTTPKDRHPRCGHTVTIRPVVGHGITLNRPCCLQTGAPDTRALGQQARASDGCSCRWAPPSRSASRARGSRSGNPRGAWVLKPYEICAWTGPTWHSVVLGQSTANFSRDPRRCNGLLACQQARLAVCGHGLGQVKAFGRGCIAQRSARPVLLQVTGGYHVVAGWERRVRGRGHDHLRRAVAAEGERRQHPVPDRRLVPAAALWTHRHGPCRQPVSLTTTTATPAVSARDAVLE